MTNRLIPLSLASVLMLLGAYSYASAGSVKQLRDSMLNKNLAAFGRVLDSGAIGLSDFESDPDLYELACVSTYETYAPFFDALLDYGVNPSLEDPEKSVQAFSLLVCARRSMNVEAFKKLLDAGARTEILLCESCPSISQEPLVQRVISEPEMFLEIVKRRELTNTELLAISVSVSRVYYHKTFNDQPLNEFYADYLRERGIDVTPKGPYKPE